MVMGNNASIRKHGEGSSGEKKSEGNFDQNIKFAENGVYLGCQAYTPLDLMVQLPPHSYEPHQPPLVFVDPQGPMAPSSMPADETIQPQIAAYDEAVFHGTRTQVRIMWNHGGNLVAVVGSWDNWETREMLQNTGKEFVIMKSLIPGNYHYRFIVDGWLLCAPDLPWTLDDSGNAFNILDLQEHVSELPESLSEFECPPSPESSYDNQILNEDDFTRPPPELPPQLRLTVLNEPSSSVEGHHRHTELNHMYIHNNVGGQFTALGSTQRFRQKYVTMLLYKPLLRTR